MINFSENAGSGTFSGFSFWYKLFIVAGNTANSLLQHEDDENTDNIERWELLQKVKGLDVSIVNISGSFVQS